LARSWLLCQRMRAKHKNGMSAKRSAKTVARKPIAGKRRSKLATLKALPGRTGRFVKSNPVRVILGAAALGVGVVVAKLKNVI
jgi:hypothetical protein